MGEITFVGPTGFKERRHDPNTTEQLAHASFVRAGEYADLTLPLSPAANQEIENLTRIRNQAIDMDDMDTAEAAQTAIEAIKLG